MDKETKGNPSADNMFGEGSDSGVFDAVEADVNGAIQDETSAGTEPSQPSPNQAAAPNQANNQGSGNNADVDWQKRYQDSSREAQRLNSEMQNLKPFLPVLNAMRQDKGLVDHVRNYLIDGGKTTGNAVDKLNLTEGFQFDANDLGDPNSDSAKVLEAQINEAVTRRVGGMMKQEKMQNAKINKANLMKAHEADFRKRHKMSEADFADLKAKANKHIMTLDDVYYILNREKTANNVANTTKQNMMNQMDNVSKMPGTQAAANSQGTAEESPEKSIFDEILGADQGRDNLFG